MDFTAFRQQLAANADRLYDESLERFDRTGSSGLNVAHTQESALLLEGGDDILLESGDRILLES